MALPITGPSTDRSAPIDPRRTVFGAESPRRGTCGDSPGGYPPHVSFKGVWSPHKIGSSGHPILHTEIWNSFGRLSRRWPFDGQRVYLCTESLGSTVNPPNLARSTGPDTRLGAERREKTFVKKRIVLVVDVNVDLLINRPSPDPIHAHANLGVYRNWDTDTSRRCFLHFHALNLKEPSRGYFKFADFANFLVHDLALLRTCEFIVYNISS